MHFLFALILSSISFTGRSWHTCAVHPFAQAQVDTGEVIRTIRAGFNEINARVAGFRKVKRELHDFSSEGGDMVRYYDGAGKLKKIVCENFGAMGKTHEEYYIRNDSLFFAYRKEYLYNEPIDVNMNPKIDKVTEDRYYFYQHKIIQWLEGKHKMGPSGNSKAGDEILDVFKKYVKIP